MRNLKMKKLFGKAEFFFFVGNKIILNSNDFLGVNK